MSDLPNLGGRCLYYFRASVAHRCSQDAAETIQVARAVRIPYVHPLAPVEDERLLVVSANARPDVFLLLRRHVIGLRMASNVLSGHKQPPGRNAKQVVASFNYSDLERSMMHTVFSFQLSAFSSQRSAFSSQHSAFSFQPKDGNVREGLD